MTRPGHAPRAVSADRHQEMVNPTADRAAAATQPGLPATTYVLSYHSVEDFLLLAQQHGAAHRERLQQFHSRGMLLMVGPLEEPMNGDAMGLFTTREAAEEFVEGDPFVINAVVARWTIRRWTNFLAG